MVYLKAASQEGTANIAGSLPVAFGGLSQSRGQRKCTALCRERPTRESFHSSRILFSQGRFARSHFNDDLSRLHRQRIHRVTSAKIALSIRRHFAYLEHGAQQSCFT